MSVVARSHSLARGAFIFTVLFFGICGVRSIAVASLPLNLAQYEDGTSEPDSEIYVPDDSSPEETFGDPGAGPFQDDGEESDPPIDSSGEEPT